MNKINTVFALSLIILSGAVFTKNADNHPRASQIHEMQVIETKIVASDGQSTDIYGNSVSISGDYAVVGAPWVDNFTVDSGAAYIYFQKNGRWIEYDRLIASDASANDWFGNNVSISGDYAIIGSPRDDDSGNESGSAYIFQRQDHLWVEKAKILPPDGSPDDWFGSAVAISGDYAIIGAYYDDDNGPSSGSTYIFVRSESSWDFQAKLSPENSTSYDFFGFSIAISGDTIIVGARGDDSKGDYAGAAYIYSREGDNWVQQMKLTASDATPEAQFGWAVGIDGDKAIISAKDDNNEFTMQGSAYIFNRTGNLWVEQEKLINPDPAWYDEYANSVAISGDSVIIGKRGGDDLGNASGTAYLYKMDGAEWSLIFKLLPSDSNGNMRFGQSVSISGDIAIVGAYWDDTLGTQAGATYNYQIVSQENILYIPFLLK